MVIIDMNNHLTIWNKMIKKNMPYHGFENSICLINKSCTSYRRKNSLYMVLIIYNSIPCLKQRSKFLN